VSAAFPAPSEAIGEFPREIRSKRKVLESSTASRASGVAWERKDCVGSRMSRLEVVDVPLWVDRKVKIAAAVETHFRSGNKIRQGPHGHSGRTTSFPTCEQRHPAITVQWPFFVESTPTNAASIVPSFPEVRAGRRPRDITFPESSCPGSTQWWELAGQRRAG
jgi:hypothetical protein